jgi:hypothetical protein
MSVVETERIVRDSMAAARCESCHRMWTGRNVVDAARRHSTEEGHVVVASYRVAHRFAPDESEGGTGP